MKFYIIIYLFLPLTFFGQTRSHPSNSAQKVLQEKIASFGFIDSINTSQSSFYSISIAEGRIRIPDSLNKKNIIGSGGFSRYTYRTRDSSKRILKSKHNYTVHYKYDTPDSLTPNTERIEMTIYYDENEEPSLAKFVENHYNNEIVLSSNLYYLNIPKNKTLNETLYYSRLFSRDLVDFIFKQSKIAKKKRNWR